MKKAFIISSTLIIMALVAGCSLGGSPTTGQTIPTATLESVVQQPTAETVVEEPTAEPAFEPEPFYTEEFEDDAPTADYYSTYYPYEEWSDQIDMYADKGKLWMDLKDANAWGYLIYNAYTYEDVAITAVVENRGLNSGTFTLVCRYDPDLGWYEFNVTPGGVYNILDVHFDKGVPAWDIIYTGGSGKVKPGNATNTFTATCIGQTLTFYVNGSEAWTVDVSTSLPQLWEGYVGFGIAGAGGANLPTTFGVDQFIIE